MSQNSDFSLDNVRTTLKRNESEWNTNLNLRTFNERFIDDYVMVPENYSYFFAKYRITF